jgi:hypothetical protein
MMTSRLRAAALLLAVCLAPAVARADVSDADRATARALAIEGQDALDRKDYAIALDRFGRADALIHAPTLLIGVARAQVGLGRLVTAQEVYNRILREGVAEGSPEPFFVALDEAKKELAALAQRVPSVTIQVKGPDAPQVTIDGQPVPLAALGARRPVDPGTRVIRATAEGFAPGEVKVTVAEGQHEAAVVELRRIESPATPAGPIEPTGPAPDQGGGGSSRTTLGIIALGVGGAGLALGAVTGVLALGKHADLKDNQCGGDDHCPESAQADIDSYHLLGTLSTIGFIAGGVGVGAGALLILTAPAPEPPKGAWIAPRVGLGYLGAEGRF